MLNYDVKNNAIHPDLSQLKHDKIDTYVENAHIDEVKESFSFQSTSLYDIRVRLQI